MQTPFLARQNLNERIFTDFLVDKVHQLLGVSLYQLLGVSLYQLLGVSLHQLLGVSLYQRLSFT